MLTYPDESAEGEKRECGPLDHISVALLFLGGGKPKSMILLAKHDKIRRTIKA